MQSEKRRWLVQNDKIRISAGFGNWEAFIASPFTLHDILAKASDWSKRLTEVERPWLCWNVDPDWCLLQQQMVKSVGWTPLVGFDPRTGPPPLIPDAILIDFNQYFGFGTMYPHFPLEFAFAFTDRLAFWHSDLLIPLPQLKVYAESFAGLRDGDLAVVQPTMSLRYRLFHPRLIRCWELLGCITRSASQNNFDHGCGWWQSFYLHPNCPGDVERKKRTMHYWDHGTGIEYWRTQYAKDRVTLIPESELDKGHFTRIRKQNYAIMGKDTWNRNLTEELPHNFPVGKVCEEFGLADIYQQAKAQQLPPIIP